MNTKIRTVLADQEGLTRLKLRQLLSTEPYVEIVGEGATASETIGLVNSSRPDLLLLDIRMPGLDGFDIAGETSTSYGFSMPYIIFTTAQDCHALRAFQVRTFDYLTKPFSAERLRSAIRYANGQILRTSGSASLSNERSRTGSTHTNRIVFKSRGRILFLPVSEIRWIAAEENYVRICTGGETHLLRETMTSLEEKLDPQVFMRVHRSAIVNLNFVKEIRTEREGDFTVLLANGQKVAMSRSYRSRMRGLLSSQ